MANTKEEVVKRLPTASTGEVNFQDVQIPSIRERRSEELVLAVVGPVGSGCSRVVQILRELLEHDFGYEASVHKLSHVITSSLPLLGDIAPSVGVGVKRVEDLQAAGNALRKRFGHEYLAAKTIERIARASFARYGEVRRR